MSIRREISSIKDFFLEINQDVFGILLITYVVFLLIEEFKKGFVTYNFNLNTLLYIIIISGILMVFTKIKKEELEILGIKPSLTKKGYILIALLGILGGLLIYFQTKKLGFTSYIISGISGALIILLSISLLKEDKRNELKTHEF